MEKLKHYMALSEMFRYPMQNQINYFGEWRKITESKMPDMMPNLEAFIEHIRENSIPARQEYYISTFDVQAICYLDIGYVLYGEDYNRGVFLVHMKKEQENAGNDCGKELPDHLPNVLTLLSKLQDEILTEELVVSMLIPALGKMIKSFNSDDNIYYGILELLKGIMESDFPDSCFEKFNFNIDEKTKCFECFPQWSNIK